MLKKIKEHWAYSVLLGAFLTWMGWMTVAALTGSSVNQVNSVLHQRITSTKAELVRERDKELDRLEQDMDRLEWLIDQMLLDRCPERVDR